MSNEPHPAGPPDETWARIARHLADEETGGERDSLRAELAAHPAREELLASLDASLGAAEEPLLSPERVEAALETVMRRRDEPVRVPHVAQTPAAPAAPDVIPLRRPQRRTAWFALPAAAVVLLAIGAAFLWRQLRQGDAPLAAVEYATGIGETERVRLADGSIVQLGPLSRLSVAGDYGDARRELRLDGEALITVTHDAARPFVVHTARAEVEDLGTAFTVRADSATTDVLVTEGSVEVRSEVAGAILRAGQRARVDRACRVEATQAPSAATDDAAAWTQGRLVFRDATLAEVADDLHRWYGMTILIPDAALARRRVTATLPTGSAAEALQVLAATAGARMEQRGDTVTVVPAR